MYETNDIKYDINIDYKGPTLLLYGTQSIFFEKKDCDSVQKLLNNVQFDYIENAEHSLVFTHPVEFMNKITPFVE